MRRPSRLGGAALATFGIGAAVLVVAEPVWLRAASAVLLLVAMFVGVAAIATPGLLGDERRLEDERPGGGAGERG